MGFSYAQLCVQKPAVGRGHPVGYGDWRVCVEIAIPGPNAAFVGTAIVGTATVGHDAEWVDLTDYVAGLDWWQGGESYEEFAVGGAQITLRSAGWEFSRFGARVNSRWYSSGTLMRIACHSPTSAMKYLNGPAGFMPLFTGVVESWADSGSERAPHATVTLVETLGRMAGRTRPVATAVGAGEDWLARLSRLANLASWPFGSTYDSGAPTAQMIGTMLDDDRLSEMVQVGVSAGSRGLMSGKDGRLIVWESTAGWPTPQGSSFCEAAEVGGPYPSSSTADRVRYDEDSLAYYKN